MDLLASLYSSVLVATDSHQVSVDAASFTYRSRGRSHNLLLLQPPLYVYVASGTEK